jgi:hypothetical protein
MVRALNVVGGLVWSPGILGSVMGDRRLARKLIAASKENI